ATTVSQAAPPASASIASGPAWARVDRPASRSPSRSAAKPAGSATAASSGRCATHSASSASTLLPAASTLARRRSGWRAMTSSAEAPMDPVAPSTATLRTAAPMSEAQHVLAQRERGQGRDHAIDAVEQAAMAGNQVAGILHAPVPLEQALEQVADHREQHRDQRHQRDRRQLPGRRAGEGAQQEGDRHAGDHAAEEALDGLVRADPRRQLALAEL